MSTTPTNDGGPAYPSGEHFIKTDPVNGPVTHKKGPLHKGMSLRDYFANGATEADIEAHRWEEDPINKTKYIRTREEAKFAYADAMIAARNQTTK